MSRFYSYLGTAQKIIGSYTKGEPLHLHVRQFFSKEKKYGSRDRKIIADLCYCYFRCYTILAEVVSSEEKLIHSAFLCGNDSIAVVKALKPDWEPHLHLPLNEKLRLLSIDITSLHGFSNLLSSSIDEPAFAKSLLIQPHLFLRLRPGKENSVIARLHQANIKFDQLGSSALRLPSGTKVDEYVKVNKEVVVQDHSSQQVLDKATEFFPAREIYNSWDVCAASGGKSILLYDKLKGKLKITVSDIREGILRNLAERMGEAGINIYRKFTADISKQVPLDSTENFDIILCDVPCSGSGTWARTPEQYFSFEKNEIDRYANLQRNIVAHAQPFLAEDGLLIYITCSVFAKENENNVEAICAASGWQCLHMDYIKGYEMGADSMFYALLKR